MIEGPLLKRMRLNRSALVACIRLVIGPFWEDGGGQVSEDSLLNELFLSPLIDTKILPTMDGTVIASGEFLNF